MGIGPSQSRAISIPTMPKSYRATEYFPWKQTHQEETGPQSESDLSLEVPSELCQSFERRLMCYAQAGPSKSPSLPGDGSNDDLQEGLSPQNDKDAPAVKKKRRKKNRRARKTRVPIFENRFSCNHDTLGTYKGIALDQSSTQDWHNRQKVSGLLSCDAMEVGTLEAIYRFMVCHG